MRTTLLMSLAALAWTVLMPVAAADELTGTWSGPWYRGMTSGTMILEIDGGGKGLVQFKNLDNFGEGAVPISRVEKGSEKLRFSAAGEGAGVFSASARLTNDGRVLKGAAEYEGFPIEFKLKRR